MSAGVSVLCLLLVAAPPVNAPATPPPERDDPRYGLLTPLPEHGNLPPIVAYLDAPSEAQLAQRARSRRYQQQLRTIRHRHFRNIRVPEIRAEGIAELDEFTDPAAFRPMIEVLGGEGEDVRHAMLDHFARQGDDGQAALAALAIDGDDDGLRREAMERMSAPPGPAVLRILDQGLRSPTHVLANRAGGLAGALGAVEAIPLLIFAQSTRDPRPSDEGDLAWIAIGTQQAFVANVVPVVGDSSGAFQPVVGVVTEGVVLRANDAVVIVYRTVVHDALVSMSTRDWGRSTAEFGYDTRRWWTWYNEEYVPLRNERLRREALIELPPSEGDGGTGGGTGG